jgi:EAL domain-containing protein (putative c-di-GMP-specific phosphodiesterase class I)/GGDEF domain-containing protein
MHLHATPVTANRMDRADPTAPREPANALEQFELERLAEQRRSRLAWDAQFLGDCIVGDRLTPLFQPIADLRSGDLLGVEGLIRGPENSPVHMPTELFRIAREAGLSQEAELAACRAVVRGFSALKSPARVFVNLSAQSLVQMRDRDLRVMGFLAETGVAPSQVVVELTEHERVEDIPRLREAADELRKRGVAFALDDFGDGSSSLRLWAELHPEYVKIDKYFTIGVHASAARLECLRALVRLRDTFGNQLVAEGIECEDDLKVVRDLGIEFGQGWFISRPSPTPGPRVPEAVARIITSGKTAVYTESIRLPQAREHAGKLGIPAPAVAETATNFEIEALFRRDPSLPLLAVVRGETPVGILSRRTFVERLAQPYYREIYGRRPCTHFMALAPLTVDCRTPLGNLSAVLAGEDQRYLVDGFVITDEGRYLGVATGESLVRAVTELRIEAARYANPLTLLPGNVPISEHIARLVANGEPFHAAYGDLNHFKPFNDQYGYWRGDQMIKLAATAFLAHCNPVRDFVGHVGGDDFVALFQSEDWEARCGCIIAQFNEGARELFDDEDRRAGVLRGEDRQGNPATFPLTTLSIGLVRVRPRAGLTHEEVASAAAASKRQAKHLGQDLYLTAID